MCSWMCVLKVGGLSHGCGLHAGHEVGVSKAGRYQALPTVFVTQARKAFCVRSAHACRLGCVLLGGRRLPRTCAALLSLFAVCSTVSTGPTERLLLPLLAVFRGRAGIMWHCRHRSLGFAALCFVWLFHWLAVFCVAVPLAGCVLCGCSTGGL